MTLLDTPPADCDPFNLFHKWFEDAKSSEPSDPDAACLATANSSGKPSARMVLVRTADSRGFAFFTNERSRKGREMAANAHAALCFHWKSIKRQVRIEGRVERVSAAEADAYYASRPRGSRIGAWASLQSEVLESRATLEARVEELEKEYAFKDIPRPKHWGGYRIVPERIEFWEQAAYRLHDRIAFTRHEAGWTIERLYP